MPVINDARADHDARYEQVWRLKKRIEREMGPSDRRFFAKNPQRSSYTRRAHPLEIAWRDLVHGRLIEPSEGQAMYTTVRRLGPGLLARVLPLAPSETAGKVTATIDRSGTNAVRQ